ncbi:PREDICTED: protein Wnt-11b-like [Corvus brachyrhynchos]|uniref:protein Wnt-11b-like n=1 Tax=Corvus brachyrhynchos TaxID=85066 RepID=UPI0008166848|nr:PREDICTED: protein Wnt-11b-like [Corvus brachyrhynchos]
MSHPQCQDPRSDSGRGSWSQHGLCRRHLEVMPSIVRAARRTQALCQQSFADMRWNCSSIQRAPSFGRDLLTGTRECVSRHPPLLLTPRRPTPFPQPAHLTLHTSTPSYLTPHTSTPSASFHPSHWKHGSSCPSPLGSPDHPVFLLPSTPVPQVLRDSLDTRCKCHGVSGSCSVKTCWKGLPDLDEIASDLKSRYLAALKVTHRLVGPRKQLIPKEGDARPVTEMDLVYLINSPDYCTPNPQLGSLGTQDRPCNRSSVGSDSCDLLCCGRGYNTYTEEVTERCHCRYRWCCSVVCRRCRRSLQRHVCK